jgi:TolA-binding protein
MPTVIPSDTDPSLEMQPPAWARRKTEIVAGIVIVILAIAVAAGYKLYDNQHESAAAQALASAKTAPDFQKVIADFHGTAASGTASILLSQDQRKDGKFAESNTTLQNFIERNPKHELTETARMAMAANLESLKKPDEALTVYQRLAAEDPRSFTAPLAMLAQVSLLKAKNQIAEARRVCETIINQYHDSIPANEAQQELRSLKMPNERPAQPVVSAATAAPSVASTTPPANPAPKK